MNCCCECSRLHIHVGAWPWGARARAPSHSANGGGRIRDSDGDGCWSKFTPPSSINNEPAANFFPVHQLWGETKTRARDGKVWDWIGWKFALLIACRTRRELKFLCFAQQRGFVFVAADDDEPQVWLPTKLFPGKWFYRWLFCSCFKRCFDYITWGGKTSKFPYAKLKIGNCSDQTFISLVLS